MKYSKEVYVKALQALAELRENVSENEKATIDFVAEAIYEKADHEEAERNEPLSLGELVRIEHEPLWILEIGTGSGYWALADICGGDGISLTQIDATYEYSNFKQYGKEWLAFRHKPKEDTENG